MAEQDKVVIVTGAASGIGAASVGAALDRGWRVCAIDVNEIDFGGLPAGHVSRLIATRADVSDANACEAAVEAAVGEFGRVDGLIHMAAVHSTKTWRELDAGPIGQWATRHATSPGAALTLCGERASLTWTVSAGSTAGRLWRGLMAPWRSTRVLALLEAL